MTSLRSLLVAAVGFGLLQVGCIGSADDVEASAIELPGTKTLDGPDGTGGTNGLNVRSFYGNIEALLKATEYAIYKDGQNGLDVNPAIVDTELLDTAAGRTVFKYAMQCALDAGLSVEFSTYTPFDGNGMLNTTYDWRTGFLSLSAKEDLFACMAAHLNPGNFSVPILLRGTNVPDDLGAHEEFIYPEAVWLATIDPVTNEVTYDVWPHPAFVDHCTGADPTAMFASRACTHGELADCGITLRDAESLKTDCTEDSAGHYTCFGRPAIETWLSEADITTLHPTCMPVN